MAKQIREKSETVDPASGDIYSVENDIGDTIVTFANRATGDAEQLGRRSLSRIGVIERVKRLITDSRAPEEFVAELKTWGVEVVEV